jgi:hypothetical protein
MRDDDDDDDEAASRITYWRTEDRGIACRDDHVFPFDDDDDDDDDGDDAVILLVLVFDVMSSR